MQLRHVLRRQVHSARKLGAHLVIFLTSVLVYWIFVTYIPSSSPIPELESTVQLLAQVLAILTGALLLGATVYFSTFKDADSIAAATSDIDNATSSFFTKYFSGGTYHGHKLRRPAFLQTLIATVLSDFLFFPVPGQENSWITYRPTWDGVWYRIYESPLSGIKSVAGWHFQVQLLHEVVICAEIVLSLVTRLRKSGAALIEVGTGSQGSNDFISELAVFMSEVSRQKYSTEPDQVLLWRRKGEEHYLKTSPDIYRSLELIPKEYAFKVTRMALRSMHYVREEESKHSRNIGWTPEGRTLFLNLYVDYLVAYAHMIDKLQVLRLANVAVRAPQSTESLNASAERLIYPAVTAEMKSKLLNLRPKIVALRGSFDHVNSVKKESAIGLTISLATLFSLLLGWPLAKTLLSTELRIQAFSVLLALGSASLLESVWFLNTLLAGKRATNAPIPLH